MATESAVYGVGRSYFLTVEPHIGPVSQAVEFELPCCRGQSFGRSNLRAPPPGRVELRAVDIFIVKPVQKVGGKDPPLSMRTPIAVVGYRGIVPRDDCTGDARTVGTGSREDCTFQPLYSWVREGGAAIRLADTMRL